MKIIKKGNKVVECKRCGCVMEFDSSDIKSEIRSITTSEFLRTSEQWEIEYIHCPICNQEIEVGHKCLKSR